MTVRQLTADDAIEILRKRWPLIILLAVVGAGLGWQIARILPKRYVSQTVVLVEEPTVPGDLVRPNVIDNVNQRLASMRDEILSRTRLEPIIKQFGLYSGDVNRVSMEDLVARLRTAIDVTPIQPMAETGPAQLPGFTVAVKFNDPALAQQISSTITSMFMEANSQDRQAIAKRTTDFLSAQLVEAKQKLDEQDAKLADFKRRYFGNLPDEAQTNLNVLTGLTSQLDATTAALARAQQDKSFTESMLTQQVASWQASRQAMLAGASSESLQAQLGALQSQLQGLRAKYTDSYPDVIKVKSDIAEMQRRIAENNREAQTAPPPTTKTPVVEPGEIQALRAQLHQTEDEIKERTAQEDDLQQKIQAYQTRIQSSPGVEQQYKAVTRDYQTALDFYNDLLKKHDQSAMATDLAKDQEGEQFQILDPANYPSVPSFPKTPLFVAGGAASGLGLAVGFFLLMELFDTSLRNEREVENLLHLPVLALVPSVKEASPKNAASLGIS